MTVPSTADLKKRSDKLNGFRKKLGPDGRPLEKQVIAAVRGAIRKAWMKSDVKLAFLYSKTIPDMDDRTRTKWLYKCEICQNMFKEYDIEVDHKQGHHVFTKLEEFPDYFHNILMVKSDDLQILCKDNKKTGHIGCHSYKTLSESHGITFDEAVVEKQVIEMDKKKAQIVIDFLTKNGYNAHRKKESRKEQLRDYFTKLAQEK